MSTPIVRVYETEQQARDAYAKLKENGFADEAAFLLTPGGEGDAGGFETLAAAVTVGEKLGKRAKACAELVKSGRYSVIAFPAFGTSELATQLLDSCGPVDADYRLPTERDPWGPGAPFSANLYWKPLMENCPAPFSTATGMPTLSSSKSYTELSKGQTFLGTMIAPLTSPNFAFSSFLGLKLLTKRRTMLGSNPLLNSRGPKKSLLGLPLLINSPTPFSSLLSLPILSPSR
ncbi:MAG: hypothetical protein EA356_01590 [Geminicoccaceae bacterium]|nr:MAG: hypothetical protein EA356_01590 [Geminicoccaceae bacterium]